MDCKKILSYIFPPLCWWCDQEWVFLCKECCGEIISYEWTTSKYTESWHIDKILIWFSYSWPIKKIIKFIKYKSVLTYCDVLVKLSREKRKSNILWSFLLYWEIPEHIKKIIIVDDLITTWSTLFALAKEIKKTYPNITIIGLIFAKN